MKKIILKKIIIVLLLSFVGTALAQEKCGSDYLRKLKEEKNPSLKIERENFDAELAQINIKDLLVQKGILDSNYRLKAGQVYNIPVIVHVLETTSNPALIPTDAEIATWIANTNKIFACTYGSPYANEGVNEADGSVMPLKLVFAKRTPECTSSTGIKRINGSSLTNYDTNGFAYDGSLPGISEAQMQGLSNVYDTSKFVNIYIVNKINGLSTGDGVLGSATLTDGSKGSTSSIIIRADIVKLGTDATLAHETGHYFSLYHTFAGGSIFSGGCAPNTSCTTDGDKVCDTSPIKDLNGQDIPTLTLNDCTNANYDSTKFNIMGYGNNGQTKFSAGQRNRVLAWITTQMPSLMTSEGALPLLTTAPLVSSCSPTGAYVVANNNEAGILKLVLKDIDHTIPVRRKGGVNEALLDYTNLHCNTKNYTTLNINQATNINITHGFTAKFLTAWIDYNNDGIFTNDEKIASENIADGENSNDRTWSPSFTVPATANTTATLRLRIIATKDSTEPLPCANNLTQGTAYDYPVKLVSLLKAEDFSSISDKLKIYPNPTNGIINIDMKDFITAKTSLYDVNGRLLKSKLIEEGVSKINISDLAKGIYLLKIDTNNGSITKQIIKQ